MPFIHSPRKIQRKFNEFITNNHETMKNQRIIPRKFRDGKTHNSYTKICFSKFNFTKLYVYNPAKTQNPAKIQNLPKIDKNSSFFVVFARKINVFCYFWAVFVHSEKSPREEMARKTVIKTYVLYTDLRILARKIARLSFAAKFYFWN